MILKFIEKNINSLSKDDIKNIAKNENVILNDKEIDIIYYYIKNEYKTLLYGDSDSIFNDLKSRINPTSYNQIKDLFDFYKNKYQNYL
ncbi:MAG: DUF2624 family protein [Bacilli bacterium]|nr:DUF2624 family protein [Bacilli bacterium]